VLVLGGGCPDGLGVGAGLQPGRVDPVHDAIDDLGDHGLPLTRIRLGGLMGGLVEEVGLVGVELDLPGQRGVGL
jgi:hypothetical protein